jgi:hypothetical protein
MRDHTSNRAARYLSPGYQFGAARWRRLSDNAAEQLQRRQAASDLAHRMVLRPSIEDLAQASAVFLELEQRNG